MYTYRTGNRSGKRRALPGTISLVAVCALVAMAMAGCAAEAPSPAPAQPAPTATSAAPAPPPTATPAPPVVLRVGTTRQIKSANPVSDYWYGVVTGLTTHDSLVSIDSEMNFAPGLADRWEASDEGKLWKFYINRNAKWHDGRPVTPEDVKFNLEYRMAKDPQSGWMKGVIDTITVEGDAVVLRLSKSYGTLLIEFDTYRVLPQHIWQKVDDPLKYNGDDATVGCGPYIVEKIDLNAGLLVFRANPDFYRGQPSVDRLEFHAFRNVDALVMALGKGEVDVTWDYSASIPYTSIPALMKSPDVKFASELDLAVPVALGFNLKRSPMSEKAFREAVSYALNYSQIAEFVFAGYGRRPTSAFVPSVMPYHDAELRALEQDRDKAGALLDGLGLKDTDGDGLRQLPDGRPLKLTLLSRSDSAVITRSAELVRADLKAVGLDATVRSLDSATWVQLKDNLEYDLVLFRTTPWGMMMHAGYGSGYFDSRRTGAGVLHNVDDPRYLALADEILRTTDENRLKELMRGLQRYYAEELPGIALAWAENVYPYLAGWEGWQLDLVHGGLVNRESLFTVRPGGS